MREFERQAFRALVEAHGEVRDFSEWLTRLVAGVTAHVGGIEELTAGRPGSWESARIEEWMQSAGCGDPEWLAGYRQEWEEVSE